MEQSWRKEKATSFDDATSTADSAPHNVTVRRMFSDSPAGISAGRKTPLRRKTLSVPRVPARCRNVLMFSAPLPLRSDSVLLDNITDGYDCQWKTLFFVAFHRNFPAFGQPLVPSAVYSKGPDNVRSFAVSALPIFPGRHQPSILGAGELNFRVRDGNGWTLAAISTDLLSCEQESKQKKRFVFFSLPSCSPISHYMHLFLSCQEAPGEAVFLPRGGCAASPAGMVRLQGLEPGAR